MKIVIATGGSGGHLFPALRTARELKSMGHEVLFLGAFRVGKKKIEEAGFFLEELDARGLKIRPVGECLYSVFLLAKAVIRSLRFLKTRKPDVVAGFGGYGAFPAVFAAVILRYPTLIHEQNVLPGRANALLARCARKIAVSFSDGKKYFSMDKTVLTGCPSHSPAGELLKDGVIDRFGLEKGRKTILVLGGSQGSRRINEEFARAMAILDGLVNFQVIHVCGKTDYEGLKGKYARFGVPFALFEFLDDMAGAYTVADLIISRAGAVTVSEIGKFRKPAVLIPYPHAGGHQIKNAEVLCAAGIGKIIEEKDLSAKRLKTMVLDMLQNPSGTGPPDEVLNENFIPDAGRRLAEEIVGLKR